MTRHKSWFGAEPKFDRYVTNHIISVGTGSLWIHEISEDTAPCPVSLPTRCGDTPLPCTKANGNDRPNLQSAPATPRTVGARYNQKLIDLALRLREC